MRNITRIDATEDNNWYLNNFIVKANEDEEINYNSLYPVILKLLIQIENNHFSKEFSYWKTGFSLVHFGNRGINVSIWHWGNWGNTIELYGQHWYCYGRDLSKLEMLNSKEPILCYFEIDIFTKELNVIKISEETENFKEIVKKYKQI